MARPSPDAARFVALGADSRALGWHNDRVAVTYRNRRIDETLGRLDRALEQNSRVIERNEMVIAKNSRVIEETRRSYEDQLEITRQFMRRNELVTTRLVDEISEMIREQRAQRGAIFALIDEMRGGGGPAPAA